MRINTFDLIDEEREQIISDLLVLGVFCLNEKGVIALTKSFHKSVNAFFDCELDQHIKKDAPPELVEYLVLSANLFLYTPKINKENFFHVFNLTLRSLQKPEIENNDFDKFWGWIEIFFEKPYTDLGLWSNG